MRNTVKRLRKQAGLRQEDMARELGVSRQTIIAVENDKYNPTLELAMKIARLLGLHVDAPSSLEAGGVGAARAPPRGGPAPRPPRRRVRPSGTCGVSEPRPPKV